MAIILFDNAFRNSLFPFSYTKAVADLRFGILSIKQRAELLFGEPVFVHTEKYLQPLYPSVPEGEHIWVDAAIVLTDELVNKIQSLTPGTCLQDSQGLIAGVADIDLQIFSSSDFLKVFQNTVTIDPIKRLQHPWHFMQWNDTMIRADFKWVTKGRKTWPIPGTVQVMGEKDIFIEEGAKLNFCTLNAIMGPIYIGKDAEIMEGTAIRGPFVLGNNSVLKLNSRVYGATTLGPFCMGGGEIKNAVMMGYSNKAHDGYLGDSVVGEWCNFGAGSTNSNVKNTAGEVKIWDMGSQEYVEVGQKCGLIMGDYSRISINASINTGSTIGVSSNVFGPGLLPTIIGNFSWGVTGVQYELSKALLAIDNWKKMKQQELTAEESSVLAYIFEKSDK